MTKLPLGNALEKWRPFDGFLEQVRRQLSVAVPPSTNSEVPFPSHYFHGGGINFYQELNLTEIQYCESATACLPPPVGYLAIESIVVGFEF